jgi:hypothetical protein
MKNKLIYSGFFAFLSIANYSQGKDKFGGLSLIQQNTFVS